MISLESKQGEKVYIITPLQAPSTQNEDGIGTELHVLEFSSKMIL